MKNKAPFIPELSRPLSIDKIPNGGMVEHMVARPDERKALCERLDLVNLVKLEADLNIDRVRAGKMVAVTGVLHADLVQTCVVTLEPISSHIEAEVNVLFAPAALIEPGVGSAMRNDMDEDDSPEPILNNMIDLGEVVSQQLAVSMDPYPRLPGAALPPAYQAEPEEQVKPVNPFVVLKKVKIKPKK